MSALVLIAGLLLGAAAGGALGQTFGLVGLVIAIPVCFLTGYGLRSLALDMDLVR